MSLFADFSPDLGKPPLTGISIRTAREGDLDPVAALAQERDGGALDAHVRNAARMLEHPDRCALLVAEDGDAFLGFGKCEYLSSRGNAPDGWYLAGIVVMSERRRRGVGRELTRARLEWIAQRSVDAYYFASAQNRVSLALHRPFGFQEVTRDLEIPGISFTGGVGILFRTDLDDGVCSFS